MIPRTERVRYAPGTRVQLHPSTDRWMRGDRFGCVVRTDSKHRVHVLLDRSGVVVKLHPSNILEAVQS